MAHFAELDDKNVVKQVIVVHNNELLDENGNESESKGIDFCQSLFGGNWKQTSFNGTIRKHFAGIAYFYDESKDAFIPPKPYESWHLDQDLLIWKAPYPRPNDGKAYFWDETNLIWVAK